MLGPGRGIDRLNRLDLRLVLLLSVALLPLGMIALLQTLRAGDEGRERAATALLGQTVQAAAAEKELIQTAIGVASAFGALAPDLAADDALCSERFERLVAQSETYLFAGYIDPEGRMRCTSAPANMNFAASPMFRDLREDPRILVRLNRQGPISGRPVVIVTVPVPAPDGGFGGAVSISLPHEVATPEPGAEFGFRPFDLVTFNTDGEILFTAGAREGVEARLPAAPGLADLATAGPRAFEAETRDGRALVFSSVPIIDDTVFALASWSPDAVPGRFGAYSLPTVIVPILMWIASLAVAYFAVHRLVVRHIRDLRHRIRVFSASRRRLPDAGTADAPGELREVADAFDALTRRVLADEADLEASLREKNVLLREVHHRVKNNLQLISSMIGMQIRRTDAEDTQRLLKRLQNRVYGLAVIHQNLYHASSLSRVRADVLVEEIVRQVLVRALGPQSRIRVDYQLEPTTLYPDQALPLAMLANEAVTNALKYVGQPDKGDPWIEVRLAAAPEDGRVALRVANSAGARLAEVAEYEGQGLGQQLMRAFLTQIGGEMQIEEEDDRYWLEVRFAVAEFEAAEAAEAAQ